MSQTNPADLCECGHPRSGHCGGTASCYEVGMACPCLEFTQEEQMRDAANDGDVCECGHHRLAHAGHTHLAGTTEPTYCSQGCGCSRFRPVPAAVPMVAVPVELLVRIGAALDLLMPLHEGPRSFDALLFDLQCVKSYVRANRIVDDLADCLNRT